MSALKRNISYLYLLVIAQYMIPLVTTPYLSRVLGVASFGNMGVALALVAYLTLIIDWGFALRGVQEVAQAANDEDEIRRIFWKSFSAKLILTLACLAFLALFLVFSDNLGTRRDVLLATALSVLSSTFGFAWLLQGLESMGTYTTSMLISRILPVPLFFLMIHGPGDAWLVALINSLSGLVATVVSIHAIRRRLDLGRPRLSIRDGLESIKEGWSLFVSTGAMSVYTTTNIVLLGLISGPIEAGYFNGADRLKRAAQAAVSPLSTAMFPRINRLIVKDKSSARKSIFILLLSQGAITLGITLAMLFGSRWITLILLGKGFEPAIPTMRWLSLAPFLIGLSNVFGINMMLPMGMRRAFMVVTMVGGVINTILLIPMAQFYGSSGAAAATVITEAVITIVMGVLAFRGLKDESLKDEATESEEQETRLQV